MSYILSHLMAGPVRILIDVSFSRLSNSCLIGRRNSSAFSASAAVAPISSADGDSVSPLDSGELRRSGILGGGLQGRVPVAVP